MNIRIFILAHMPTKAVNVVMIGPGFSEIFGVICGFLPYSGKSCLFLNRVNFEVARSNLTKIIHNAGKCMPFNLLKLELRYFDWFRNNSATIKIGPRKTPKATLIGCHGNVP